MTARNLAAAALAAGLALASSPPVAFAHGGGGGGGHVGGGGHGGSRSTYVVVLVPGGDADAPLFRGDEVAMALEVTDPAPAVSEGDMKLGDVVAERRLRAADAIVLMETANGRRRTVPAGTVLARVDFVAARRRPTIWCDIRPTNRPLWPQEHDCFEDTRGDGHLDKIWEGDSQNHFLPFSLSGVGYYHDPMPAPVAYRAARPEERPTAVVGFKYCADDTAGDPLFALALAIEQDPRRAVGACQFGGWATGSGTSTVQIAGATLAVTPAQAGKMHFKVIGGMAPGPLRLLAAGAPTSGPADAPAGQMVGRF